MADNLIQMPKTILVVDDLEIVLQVIVTILKWANFTVLCTANAGDAVELAHRYPERIDLLLCNVLLPEMSGPALGILLKKSNPEMRIILMPGMLGSGDLLVLNYGGEFIEKPFAYQKLLRTVNSVLSTPDRFPDKPWM